MQYDFSKPVNNFELVETGTYELVIDKAELGRTETGLNYIGFTFIVRDDVDQEYAGTKIWDKIWENDVYRDTEGNKITKQKYDEMTPAQKQNVVITKEYNNYKLNVLVHAQDCDLQIEDENGNKIQNPAYITKFSNIEEIVLFLNGMCVQAKVLKVKSEKDGRERNQIDFNSIKRTSVSKTVYNETVADDEELPF